MLLPNRWPSVQVEIGLVIRNESSENFGKSAQERMLVIGVCVFVMFVPSTGCVVVVGNVRETPVTQLVCIVDLEKYKSFGKIESYIQNDGYSD